ncbi:type II and III secretion system protein family protein [Aliiroseovarius crassostreae]|uniref:type II and III secretion system protein family protein n=1 Tax=Aliiroseovarius crassostreae TaxID=154981 RepID=UPI0021FF661F|nr:type II and III secretion system protein family protein [Aliiroseovarius crassostreae]UWQ06929.1 type II and III secretion system protein family protein [Aliiroseovarius crassostreae]UWQ10033.1 type II and III secretion system protein family protein [Aliiroseovarius crassostreae]
MKIDKWMKAALLGVAIGFTSIPTGASAETLRVMKGAASSALNVPMNRAVVVESEVPFAELSIANPGIADFSTLSDRTIYVLGKAPGRTTLTLLGGDGRLITNVEIHVAPDIAEFKERLRQILPGEPIEVRTANDGIVLSGTVSSIGRMDRALDLASRYAPDRVSNLMTVGGTQQVMLKVRFAEMQRSVRKALSGSLAIKGGTNLGVVSETGTWLDGANDLGNSTITPSSGTEGAFALGFNAGAFEIGILLEALESKGVVRTLSEPNLTALSGQEASFLAGGEYPVPVANGDNGISIDYKPFGIEMTFTPRVLADDVINLDLKAAVSGLDSTVSFNNGGFNVNAFRRRETSTVVELRDGESFAIAGLIEDDFRDLSGQVPWLGDIPVLGSLFRSAEYERRQSELVVIVTAHLVTPTRGDALALPTDRIKPPSEQELFLFGKTASPNRPTKGAAGEVAKQDFSGSYGYVMEDN